MRSDIFESFELIPIFNFLSTLKLVCDKSEVYEGAALRLLQIYEAAVAAALNVRVILSPKSHKCGKQSSLSLYCEVVSYLLKTCAADDVIVKTDSNMMQFAQLQSESRSENAEAL